VRERSGRGFFEGCEVRRGEVEGFYPGSRGKPIEAERSPNGNAANLVRRRLQYTGVRSAEKTVEVGWNHEGGTRIAGGTAVPKGGNPREWTRSG
jgi:hypothetical protein